jgi:hypothetical protein
MWHAVGVVVGHVGQVVRVRHGPILADQKVAEHVGPHERRGAVVVGRRGEVGRGAAALDECVEEALL